MPDPQIPAAVSQSAFDDPCFLNGPLRPKNGLRPFFPPQPTGTMIRHFPTPGARPVFEENKIENKWTLVERAPRRFAQANNWKGPVYRVICKYQNCDS